MPKNFLLDCKEYLEVIREPEILDRVTALCKYLTYDYRFHRGKRGSEKRQKAISAIQTLGLKRASVRASAIDQDQIQLSFAYRYLNAKDKERARLETVLQKKHPQTKIARILIKLGITRWEDIYPPKEKDETVPYAITTPSAIEEPAILPKEPRIAFLRSDFEKLHQAAGIVSKYAIELHAKLEELVSENERLVHEKIRQEERIATLEQEVRLTETLHLEELAARFPDFPQLFELTKKIKTHRDAQEQISQRLPQKAGFFESIPMQYTRRFLDVLQKLAQSEQEQVIKALTLLAEKGPQHPSLNTQNLLYEVPGVPAGSKFSRASDVLRFYWAVINNELWCYTIVRRGNSQYFASER